MSVKTFRDIYQGSTTSNGVTTSVRLGMLYQRWSYSDSSMESAIASCASISTGWGPGVQTAYGSDHPNTKEKIIAPAASTNGTYALTTGGAQTGFCGYYDLNNVQTGITSHPPGYSWISSYTQFYLAGIDRSRVILVPSVTARDLQGNTWSGSLKAWSETYGRTFTYITSMSYTAYYKQNIVLVAPGTIIGYGLLGTKKHVQIKSGTIDGRNPKYVYQGDIYPHSAGLLPFGTTDSIYNEGGNTYWQSFCEIDGNWALMYYYNYLHYKPGETGDDGYAPFWYYNYSDCVNYMNQLGMWWAEDVNAASNCHGEGTTDEGVHAPQIDDNGFVTGEYFSGNADSTDPNSIFYNFNSGGSVGGIFNPLGYYDITGHNNISETNQPLSPAYPIQTPAPLQPGDPDLELQANEYNGVGIFGTYYCGSRTAIQGINDALWNIDQSVLGRIIDGLKLYGSDPANAIISLRIYPFNVAAQVDCTSTNVYLGIVDIGIPMFKIAENASIVLDLGSFLIEPKFQSFLDLAPYTTITVYVPFVGNIQLPTNEFMGRTLRIQMSVDLTTGQCVACIFANETPMIYSAGQIGVEIPVTARTGEEVAKAFIEAAAAVVTRGASTLVDSMADDFGVLFLGDNSTEKTGASSPSNSFTMPLDSYVIVSRPTVEAPENFAHTYGKVCHTTGLLNDMAGFTVCKNVDVTGITATEEERSMIKTFLESGVFI